VIISSARTVQSEAPVVFLSHLQVML